MGDLSVRSIRHRMWVTARIIMMTAVLAPASSWAAGETAAKVKAGGAVRCGVTESLAGFAFKDAAGRWQGLNVDFCRALAAAVLGDPDKIALVPLSAPARFPALLAGRIDVLLHATTWTLGREAGIGVHFAGTYFYDGQGFMVPKESPARSVADLKAATICVEKGTTTVENLADYFRARNWPYRPLVADSVTAAADAFLAGRCRVFTADRSQLAAVRARAAGGAAAYRSLPGVISKEPLGPVVRRGDEQWLTLVRWVLFALIEAEERNVTRANVRGLSESATDPALRRFLGADGGYGKALGVSSGWVVRAIAAAGNYGEIYERNFGGQSALRIERGLNRLGSRGGLMVAPPFN